MDIRSRTKIAFVVERYGLDEVGESGRRTRAMATALAARGHDVTVLTTCARQPDRWENETADGKSSVEGVRVVRFRLVDSKSAWLSRPVSAIAKLHPSASRLALDLAGPHCAGYRRHLDHLGYLFDAVFFTGNWGHLVTEGLGRVRNAVLCPPPIDDPHRSFGHVSELFRAARAMAVADAGQKVQLRKEAGLSWPCPTYITGAAPDPLPKPSHRMRRMHLVDGPYLLHVGLHGPAADKLVEAFRFFREAHATTAIEDDSGERRCVRDLRLVLAGDFRFPHAPEEGVIGLGSVDASCRAVLLERALAVVHPDPSNRIPTELLVAWTEGRPTLVHSGMSSLATVLDRIGPEYVYDSPGTFAASAASLLSSRSPRRVLGARASEMTRRIFSTTKLVDTMERCIQGVVGRAKGQVLPIDSSV